MALHQRLLRDIAEFQSKPYPYITFIPRTDIRSACLILTPEAKRPIHLTVNIPQDFPLHPPTIACDTQIRHPNVFGRYICASILNTKDGYTPAYTLQGIAIQILSFFNSDHIEQSSGRQVDLRTYRQISNTHPQHRCPFCQFGIVDPRGWATSTDSRSATTLTPVAVSYGTVPKSAPAVTTQPFARLPDEILAIVCDKLESEDLSNLARSWNRVGGPRGIVTKFNILRNRELQCFVLKKSFRDTPLGIGVDALVTPGRKRMIASEFDLISDDAYKNLRVRTSVHGTPFRSWLPLPLSRSHYALIKDRISGCLGNIARAAELGQLTGSDIIYHFLNDIVVRLSQAALPQEYSSNFHQRLEQRVLEQQDSKSTLKHASEKAIESYFHIFHLLLCLATTYKSVVQVANGVLEDFKNGYTSKAHCPNLGHLLIASLIADVDFTQQLRIALIREAVTRNVVWMLDKRRGAGKVDLVYMEPDEVCEYRLSKTFQASKTSYRLLMFINLFRLTVNRGSGHGRKTLVQMRDELYDSHGAPPFGAAARLAHQVKEIQNVDNFLDFLAVMGIEHLPTKVELTEFLRNCVRDSMRKGYSVPGASQTGAKAMREGVSRSNERVYSFFPSREHRGYGFPGLDRRSASRGRQPARCGRDYRARGGSGRGHGRY
ncbi:uncharacterized protein PV06_01180 [Exophiala oligosperma]|uniref:UBC core domain-containing protein n=2 Tax=Chaetothyriales TaxID=34395 RepID=A0A0D2EL55_9EURO|nr:uncharacterized protein PV06_01180 [Exophiala oligosperma]KAJ9636032.1 hypothetical protein H2204_005529 [Knufia peltigerae]KIW48609.1 hypothetical protein PV06_01180 [Exophiala oligosperma]